MHAQYAHARVHTWEHRIKSEITLTVILFLLFNYIYIYWHNSALSTTTTVLVVVLRDKTSKCIFLTPLNVFQGEVYGFVYLYILIKNLVCLLYSWHQIQLQKSSLV